MYHLNRFCHVIASLRQKRAWSQAQLAEQIGISPQSVSKWECGIGYPDVTLFPVLAELFGVPIGVLFGEEDTGQDNRQSTVWKIHVYRQIHIYIGNVCRIEVIDGACEEPVVEAEGDAVFIKYFDIEESDDTLNVYIRNPSGSDEHWSAYDRRGYDGENQIRIHTGCENSNVCFVNYLDLLVYDTTNRQGNCEVLCVRA